MPISFQMVRSSAECLAKAEELELRAAQTGVPMKRAEYLDMAACWRALARHHVHAGEERLGSTA